MNARPLLLAALLATLLLPACAFQNRENRRLWNAFEAHLVPEDDDDFLLALPLTLPGGLVAITLDVFVVHPVSVIDDAWDDAVGLWDDTDWSADYWAECGIAPLRAAGSMVWFVGSLLGRAVFDVTGGGPTHGPQGRALRPPDEQLLEVSAAEDAAVAERLAAALRELANGRRSTLGSEWPAASYPEVAEGVQLVLAQGSYRARIALFRWALHAASPDQPEPWAGLRDADPRVRAALLALTSRHAALPEALRQALLADPDPVVAELAWQLLGNRD